MKLHTKVFVILVAVLFAASLFGAGCSKKSKEEPPTPPPNQKLPTPKTPPPNTKTPPRNVVPPPNTKTAPPNVVPPPNTKTPPPNQVGTAPGPNQQPPVIPPPNQKAPVPGSGPNVATPPQQVAKAPAGAVGDSALFEKRCSKCHELDRVRARRDTPAGWRNLVERMKLKMFSGISDEEAVRIAQFLASTQGK